MRDRPSRTAAYAVAWLALLGLLAATAAIGRLHLGTGNLVASLSIAVLKAAIVLWIFMGMRHATALVRLAAAAGLFVLALSGLALADFLPRHDERAAWQAPHQLAPGLAGPAEPASKPPSPR